MPSAAPTIDRLCVVVADLETAAAEVESLGFTLTPQGRHMVGSRNRCVMLRDGQYLELLDPHAVVPDPASIRYAQRLAQYGEGLAVLSLRCEEPDAVAEAWRSAGFSPSAIRPYSRTVDLPGRQAQARFELIQLAEPPLPGLPGLAVCACRQLTPELVWRAEHLEHRNGASGVVALDLVSASPVADAQILARLASAQWWRSAGRATVRIGNVHVRFQAEPAGQGAAGRAVLTLRAGGFSGSNPICGVELRASPNVTSPNVTSLNVTSTAPSGPVVPTGGRPVAG